MRSLALLLVLTAISEPALAQEFSEWEGKQAVKVGEGGARKNIDGVDFWTEGTPPKPYILIGYLLDTRHESGLYGMMRMSSLERSIAKKAKQVGGDAVVFMDSASQKYFGEGIDEGNRIDVNINQSDFAGPMTKRQSKYAVLRYVTQDEQGEKDGAPQK